MYIKTTCPCCGDVNYNFVSITLTERVEDDGTIIYSLVSAESRDVIHEDEFINLIINTIAAQPNVIETTDLPLVLRKIFGVSKTDCQDLSLKVKAKAIAN